MIHDGEMVVEFNGSASIGCLAETTGRDPGKLLSKCFNNCTNQ